MAKRGGGREKGPGRPCRRWLRRLLLGFLVLVLALAAMHQHVVLSVAGRIHGLVDVPEREAILVPGARIHAGGRPSQMLADRLRMAAALHAAGKAPVVLLSGDNIAPDYDEVTVMRDDLLRRGVPEEAIRVDRAGLRTLDSMARARSVFGLEGVIVVTNPFHVRRAVFLAVHHGLDAVGVPAPHGVEYSWRTLFWNRGREVAARLLAWWDVFILEK